MMNRINSNALGLGALIILALPAAAIRLIMILIFFPIAVDNAACAQFEREVIKCLNLPDGAEVICYDSTCANTGGTGDHTELCVAVAISSDVPIDPKRATALCRGYAYIEKRPEELVGMGISLGSLPENCYVLVALRSAPMSSFDLRGV